MNASKNSSTKNTIDARIINLYQRNVNGTRLFAAGSQYNVFAHYEVIEVLPANRASEAYTDESPLLRAYDISSKENHSVPRQTLLAFIDILEESGTGVGYTHEQIEAFWNNYEEPLMFLSMISLDVDQKHISVLEKIEEVYAGMQHLAYISFDYCNIIIFSKGRSFQQCAENLLKLDFASGQRIVDSITLYSFTCDFGECLAAREPEIFGAYLRIGVTDLNTMEEYFNALPVDAKGNRPEINWIIGRHDVGIFCRNANLNWLANALAAAAGEKWYNDLTLSVMIAPSNIPIRGKLSDPITTSSLSNTMKVRFEEFQRSYHNRCQAVGVYEDFVWLRWLRETSELAVNLLGNKMTYDLGISLVPQFLDFLDYARQLWSNEGLNLGKRWDEAQKCFATLLSNVSILVDSMNHHSRQFITSPPFRTVAFSMPPKLMAYYIMVLHQLIIILRDEAYEHQYGFTITPQFTQTLNVRALTTECRELLNGSQYITISISEGAMFRLQHTTAVLAHEISHFVGWESRSRPIRKHCVLYAELYNITLDITQLFFDELKAYYNISHNITDFSEENLPIWIEQLQNNLIRTRTEYTETKSNFSTDLKALLQYLPFRIYNTRILCEELFQCCWNLLLERDGHLLQLGNYVVEVECARAGIQVAAGADVLNLSRQRLYRMFQNLLQTYSKNNYLLQSNYEQRWNKLCEAFSETYADLQTILLLQLNFDSYIRLFTTRSTEKIPQIEYGRILALMVTLDNRTGWTDVDFSKYPSMHELVLRYKTHDLQSLAELSIDLIAVEQLQKYLSCCAMSLEKKLNKRNPELQNLRALYSVLANGHSATELVEKLSDEILKYRQYLLNL